jgi:DNA-binding transcriptional ArsR family regulator
MDSTSNTASADAMAGHPPLNAFVRAVGHPFRWRMLLELGKGELRSIGELAAVAGCGYDNAGRHLAILKKAGLVEQGRGRLYQMTRRYVPASGATHLEFGHCRLRLPTA